MNDTRCGFVALIGAPNAGKSTLINALVGSKVSIVSRKAQTTRAAVRGIVVAGATQIVFVDTPGLFAPKRRLDRAMLACAWGAAGDADALALLIDARQESAASAKAGLEPANAGLSEPTQAILRALSESKGPKFLVLNKIDLTERPQLLALAAGLNAALKFDDTFMISAATGDGLDRLRERLAAAMPPGPWLYPVDQIADAPMRSLAAEITREKLFERLHDELPYQTTVETEFVEGFAQWFGAHRADDLRQPRKPQENRHRRGRAHDQGDRRRRAQRDRRGQRDAGASLSVRQGARELARRSRTLPRHGAGVSQAVTARRPRRAPPVGAPKVWRAPSPRGPRRGSASAP